MIAVFSAIKIRAEEVAAKTGQQKPVSDKVNALKMNAGKIAVRVTASALKHTARKLLGDDAVAAIAEGAIEETIDDVKDQAVNAFEGREAASKEFRKSLAELVGYMSDFAKSRRPVFLFIDELDRCRPTYAISLLERVKHLFSIEGLVFVFATDLRQLSFSIAGQYGPGFDGEAYLKRLFERTYRFRPRPLREFVVSRFQQLGLAESDFGSPPNDSPIDFLAQALLHCKLSLRDAEQLLEKLQTFRAVWPFGQLEIQLPYLLPKLIAATLSRAQLADGRPKIEDLPVLLYEPTGRGADYNSRYRGLGDFVSEVNQCAEDLFGVPNGHSDALASWVKEVFLVEAQKLHNNSFRHGARPASVLLRYDELLATVAQFK